MKKIAYIFISLIAFSCNKIKEEPALDFQAGSSYEGVNYLADIQDKNTEIDSLTREVLTWKWKYDSLLLECNFAKPKKVVSSTKPKAQAKPKETPVVTPQTPVVTDNSAAMLSLAQENKNLTQRVKEQEDYIAQMGQYLGEVTSEKDRLKEELSLPREGQFVTSEIAVRSQAYQDTTIYQIGYMPKLNVEAYRIKKPITSFKRRRFEITATDTNRYNIGNKSVTKTVTRDQMPKIKKK